MSTDTIEAVFKGGAFHPLSPVDVAEGQHVRLVVEAEPADPPALALAMQVYDGLTEEEIDEVERIILNRDRSTGNDSLE